MLKFALKSSTRCIWAFFHRVEVWSVPALSTKKKKNQSYEDYLKRFLRQTKMYGLLLKFVGQVTMLNFIQRAFSTHCHEVASMSELYPVWLWSVTIQPDILTSHKEQSVPQAARCHLSKADVVKLKQYVPVHANAVPSWHCLYTSVSLADTALYNSLMQCSENWVVLKSE